MTPFVDQEAGGIRWHVRADLADELAGAGLEHLLETATVVKHSSYRTVYRVCLPSATLYLKRNRVADARSWFRALLRPCKARTEFDLAVEVARRGVPTAEPLAFGEGHGESFLATRALDDVQPLGVFLTRVLPGLGPARRGRLRRTLASTLARFLEGMHRAGVLHRDLHPDNLLLRLDQQDDPALFLIDLSAVTLRPTLGEQERLENLVLVNRWFALRSERGDRARFWMAYWEAWRATEDRQARKRAAAWLETETGRSNAAFWRHLDRRSLQNNRRYRRLRGGPVTGYAVADLDPAFLQALRDDPDAPFRLPNVQWLKDGRSSKVIDWPQADGRSLIYKRFEVTTWSDPWAALVRRSPPLRSWVQGHALRLRWLPTPRPVAVLFRRRAGLEREGYLLTEKVPGAMELHQALARLGEMEPAEGRRWLRRLIDQAARLVRNLHERGLSHRDLKAANLLVTLTAGPDVPVAGTDPHLPNIWLIDLVGVRRHNTVGRARRVQGLARLNASFLNSSGLTRGDRLRFLRLYLGWGVKGRAGWKEWWSEVEGATRAKEARNRSRGRPLA